MLTEVYRGWVIYYSIDPTSLWTATKGVEKDLHSYFSLQALKGHIDRKILKDALTKAKEQRR